jgi:hypothetical protein
MLRSNIILVETDLDDFDIEEIQIKILPKVFLDISDQTKLVLLNQEDLVNNTIVDSKLGLLYNIKDRRKLYVSKL